MIDYVTVSLRCDGCEIAELEVEIGTWPARQVALERRVSQEGWSSYRAGAGQHYCPDCAPNRISIATLEDILSKNWLMLVTQDFIDWINLVISPDSPVSRTTQFEEADLAKLWLGYWQEKTGCLV